MIRLSRIGKKNHPTYRVVVSDKQKDMRAPYLEAIGNYNPHTQPSTFVVDKERLAYWIGVGAQLSDTIYNLCITHKLIEGDKRDNMHKQKKAEEEGTTEPAKEAAGGQTEPSKDREEKSKEVAPKEVPKAEEKKEEKPAA